MIDLAKYRVVITEESLVTLTSINESALYNDLTTEQQAIFTADIEAAESQAEAIITQRFGDTPTNTDFLETATVAGVAYLLSRKSNNKVSKDDIDIRRNHFYDLLPSGSGSVSQAEIQQSESRLGEWI